MKNRLRCSILIGLVAAFVASSISPNDARAQNTKPNILVIMGDDVGITNISAYSRHPEIGQRLDLAATVEPGPGHVAVGTPVPRVQPRDVGSGDHGTPNRFGIGQVEDPVAGPGVAVPEQGADLSAR